MHYVRGVLTTRVALDSGHVPVLRPRLGGRYSYALSGYGGGHYRQKQKEVFKQFPRSSAAVFLGAASGPPEELYRFHRNG
jgi:hypothetical protein